MAHQPALLRPPTLALVPQRSANERASAKPPSNLRVLPYEPWLFQTRALARVAGQPRALRSLLEKRYARLFAASERGGIYYGLFDTFGEAAKAVPASRPAGYDTAEAGQMYRDRLEHVYPSDYPVLLWLKELLPSVRRVFDLGGHVGIARYAYARYLPFNDDHDWTVYDLPAVVEAGRELAQSKGMAGLHFTTSLDDADGADVLFSSGALQYIEQDLSQILARLNNKPKWLLLNQLPLTDQPTRYTLQHIGTAICPYAIRNRARFVGQLEELGYVVEDRWDNAEKSCHIPFHASHSLDSYNGFLLKLPR